MGRLPLAVDDVQSQQLPRKIFGSVVDTRRGRLNPAPAGVILIGPRNYA
jgi:hypothetical protein